MQYSSGSRKCVPVPYSVFAVRHNERAVLDSVSLDGLFEYVMLFQ